MQTTKLTKDEIDKRYLIFNEAKTKLKNDFYGLNDIINNIFKDIETWYIYPEYMTRPCIINLWGLTGVGKTDLVRKLRLYLKIEKFAATEMDNMSSTIEDISPTYYFSQKNKSIFDLLNQYSIGPSDKSILLLDEIHRYRTIDMNGKTIQRTRFNDIWKLLSDGCLFDSSYGIHLINDNISAIEAKYDNIRMSLTERQNTLEEKINSVLGTPDSVNKNELEKEKKERDNTIKKLGYIPWNMKNSFSNSEMDSFNSGNANICRINEILYTLDIDEDDMNMLRQLKYIYQGSDDMIVSEFFLRSSSNESGEENGLLKYFKCCSNKVMLEWLKYKKVKLTNSFNKLSDIEMRIENSKFIYSKMLIFICGNLDKDEYTKNENDFNKININNILNSMFRPEQISRFGNTYIVYPILSKEEYDDIIYREIKYTEDRIRKEYDTDKITFDKEFIYNETLKELPKYYIYNGVRPVYSAVQRALSNVIPKMLIELLK